MRVAVTALTAATAGIVTLRLLRTRRLARELTGAAPFTAAHDGVRLHVETAGAADCSATVVFAHGFAADVTMFDRQWSALLGRARLVRYDQRGHGRSGWAGSRCLGVEQLGQDLGRVVDELGGPGRIVLVGHSMGGMAVLDLARQQPDLFGERIAAVALLSTASGPLRHDELPPGPLLPLVRLGLAPAAARLLWIVAPAVQRVHPFRSRPGRRWLRRRLFAQAPPDDAVRLMDRTWARTPLAVLTALLTGLTTYDAGPAVDALRNIPILVLAGTGDATLPDRGSLQLARQIGSGARLLLVPGAGHLVPLTHPDAVNAALRALLARAGVALDEGRAS